MTIKTLLIAGIAITLAIPASAQECGAACKIDPHIGVIGV